MQSSLNEQQNLAEALIAEKHCLLVFYSRGCVLCNRLQPEVASVGSANSSWLQTVSICADDDCAFAPEMLRFGVEKVPSFVLLNPEGRALLRSKPPRSYRQMLSALHGMLHNKRQQ